MAYLLYCDNSSVTGRELKRVLGVEGGSNGPDRRPDRIIRWGNRAELRFQASVNGGVLNKKQALTDASNKGRCLELLTNAGVNTPPAATQFDGELLVGRTETHVGGSGFYLITSQRDFELAGRLGCTHFMAYIPTQREYRIHVFKGAILGAGEKLMDTDNCTSLHIRNVGTGWTFRYNNIERIPRDTERVAVDAVTALGLDFGAVDIIKSVNNNFYVLEVNTAPSLCKPIAGNQHNVEHGPMFDQYVEAFRNWLQGR